MFEYCISTNIGSKLKWEEVGELSQQKKLLWQFSMTTSYNVKLCKKKSAPFPPVALTPMLSI